MERTLWAARKLYDRLVARFQLHTVPQQPEDYKIGDFIQPVTVVDDLLLTTRVITEVHDLTAAAGTFFPYFYSVLGKRWKLVSAFVSNSTGTTALHILSQGIYAQWETPSNIGRSISMHRFPMRYNDQIGLLTTGNPADGSIRLTLFLEDEDTGIE
jgi:hypothetical protein